LPEQQAAHDRDALEHERQPDRDAERKREHREPVSHADREQPDLQDLMDGVDASVRRPSHACQSIRRPLQPL